MNNEEMERIFLCVKITCENAKVYCALYRTREENFKAASDAMRAMVRDYKSEIPGELYTVEYYHPTGTVLYREIKNGN